MFLNCKTWFSFSYGTMPVIELIESAVEAGADVLALTNINNTCDAWDFVQQCQGKGIKPIVGTEIRNDNRLEYILLARNNKGYNDINSFLSRYLSEQSPFPKRPDFDLEHVWVIYPYGIQAAELLNEHEIVGVKVSDLNRFVTERGQVKGKYMALYPVTFKNKQQYNVHRLLRAVQRNALLSKVEPWDVASPNERFVPESEVLCFFKEYPTLVNRTLELIQDCHVEFDFVEHKNKKLFGNSEQEDIELLKQLAYEGCVRRYGSSDAKARERVEKELSIINMQQFTAYFLIVWDLIRYADLKGYAHVGRGSGANSVVAYCLGITDVDPIALNLYFERFLNPSRTSPPDFDIDFSWKERDYIYSYLIGKYGKEYCALLGTYTTFQKKAIIRELGKVFGLPKEEIDALVAYPAQTATDEIHRLILRYSTLMLNIPRHMSIHAGGIMISEEPLTQYAAVHLPPKGFPTLMMDMFEAERISLHKLDILSQRGLGHIKDCIALVEESCNIKIDIHNVQVLIADPQLADNIKNADTIGCFYIESPAMRQLLTKLRCSDYETLVAASSIIRPGVAQSGMMRQYIERHHNPEKTVYLHPKMEELLSETYGVMVYQEDVIKVAHHFGGISLEDADILRRAMSGKYRSNNRFEILRDKFIENCLTKGYEETVVKEVWRQMESFGGYSFAKGHSASFAVESYQSLYLKTYYPKEFYVAVINNFGGYYKSEFYFHELHKRGVKVSLPCVNRGDILTRIVGGEVYVGFGHVLGLEVSFVELFLQDRRRNGDFVSLIDFIERMSPKPEQLNILIRVEAFRFVGENKKKLLWEANFFNGKAEVRKDRSLFENENNYPSFQLPFFGEDRMGYLRDQMELLGFVVGDYFELLDSKHLEKTTRVKDFPGYVNRTVSIVGRLVDIKYTTTVKKDKMAFGTFLDPVGDWLDTVHFPESLRRYPFKGKGFYKLSGVVSLEFDVYTIIVHTMIKLPYKNK